MAKRTGRKDEPSLGSKVRASISFDSKRGSVGRREPARSFSKAKTKINVVQKYHGVQSYTTNQMANRNLNFIQELSSAKRQLYDHLPKVPTGAASLNLITAQKDELGTAHELKKRLQKLRIATQHRLNVQIDQHGKYSR